MKPLAIDLCCGVGGASMGLARAGYRVIGVDINPQPRYPFEFVQANALTFDISPADLVWASWPCQRWSKATPTLRQAQHPDLIEPGRQMLQQWGGPYVLENVTGAPLRTSIMLCGSMFGLNLFRHRNFESNFYLWQPEHPTWCKERVTMRRGGTVPTLAGRAGGKGGSTQTWREASGIPWAATARELAQSIPPSYSEYIGRQANAIGNTNKRYHHALGRGGRGHREATDTPG